jgi:hypothetical protein
MGVWGRMVGIQSQVRIDSVIDRCVSGSFPQEVEVSVFRNS